MSRGYKGFARNKPAHCPVCSNAYTAYENDGFCSLGCKDYAESIGLDDISDCDAPPEDDRWERLGLPVEDWGPEEEEIIKRSW